MLHGEEGKMIVLVLFVVWQVSFWFSLNEFNELLDEPEIKL